MPRQDIKVRMANDDEAEIVSNLVSEIFDMGGWMPKFETVFPYWLVAEIAGEIVGTINIRIALPISSVELLSIDPVLGKIERSRVFSMLLDSAYACCGAAGAEAVSSMIPDELPSYQKVLEDRNVMVGGHGAIMFGRLR